ncbi:YfhO family protein [Macrococcus armenti]|uniref:YfhO family protein n=1 Tax=Macrococcus armenti TaxID=2875764 RepID=UPI001CCF9365|nr:YfhO family protein [Macrococcus armenti]UBH14031.1 YfhO family protein [Macrococcus armenti]
MKRTIKRFPNITILLVSILCAIIAHSVVLYRMFDRGTLFTGKGDGIAQMIPFQMYLYNKFSHFHFFYDMDFGIGGDFFKSLSYYYATSPITYMNFIFVYIGDLFLPYDVTDPVFWVKNQIFISIIKLTLIFFVTYKFLRYMKLNRFASFTGSFMYGWSTAYYFFTFTWSFFSDVMLWLPMTILGLERLFKERKPLLFIISIALTLHANFYFSYYEFIFVSIYFIYRTLFQKESDILNRKQKLLTGSISGLLALMISSVGFFTGATSYLMNDRTLPPIKLNPIIDMVGFYNLFYDGYYVVISAVAVIALATFALYKHYDYRLYAILSLIFMIGSLSPYFDSFFNGFSIDQRRWIYLLVFTTSVLSAIYLNKLSELTIKSFFISLIPAALIYPISIVGHEKFLIWLIFIPIFCLFIGYYIYNEHRLSYILTHVTIFIMTNFFVYGYMTEQIDTLHPEKERNIDFITSKEYNSPIQKRIINEIKEHQKPGDRIDWQTSITHNTPMLQQFNGVKLYSSIFNKDIYQFYDKDLNITMDTDSNSIYYRLGERANLNSLFNVNQIVRENESITIPYGYERGNLYAENDLSKKYYVYNNTHPLPFVRVTDKVFDAKDLKQPIDREHAMLDGVVLNDAKAANSKVKPTANLKDNVKENLRGASLNGEKLVVTTENGGITYKLNKDKIKNAKDLYVTMAIESKTATDYHYVWINEIYQSRKPLNDDYRRFNPVITLKVKASDIVELKLKPGTYQYKLLGIYGEDYEHLKLASKNQNTHLFKKNKDKMEITLAKHKAGYVVIPVPYLEGMKANVDGKDAPIMEGNYLMTAVKVDKDAKHITIKYTPPYFRIMQIISILGMILTFFYVRRLKLKKIKA